MTKEKLTLSDIWQDLKVIQKTEYIPLILFSALFAFAVCFFLLFLGKAGLFHILTLMVGCCMVAALVGVVEILVRLVKLTAIVRNPSIIAKDKLVGLEQEDHIRKYGKSGLRLVQTYDFYFAEYGEYVPSDYPYEKMHRPSAEAMYQSAMSGDEFYVVLSHPHNGNILLAYNTKTFEFKES